MKLADRAGGSAGVASLKAVGGMEPSLVAYPYLPF